MDPKLVVPTSLTLGNLLCGFLSAVYTAQGKLPFAAWWILLAWLLDGLDGQVARIVGSSTKFGAELDSLADMTSFGLAPSLLLVGMYGTRATAFSLVFIACGAVRLAKFDARRTQEKANFSGLPIPAAAWTLASYVLFPGGGTRWVALALAVLTGVLMLSHFEYDAMCFPLGSAWGKVKLALFLVGALLIVLFPSYALFPLSLVYVASGPVRWLVSRG